MAAPDFPRSEMLPSLSTITPGERSNNSMVVFPAAIAEFSTLTIVLSSFFSINGFVAVTFTSANSVLNGCNVMTPNSIWVSAEISFKAIFVGLKPVDWRVKVNLPRGNLVARNSPFSSVFMPLTRLESVVFFKSTVANGSASLLESWRRRCKEFWPKAVIEQTSSRAINFMGTKFPQKR